MDVSKSMPDIGSLAIQAPKDIFDLDTALQQFFGGSLGATILLVLTDYLVEGAFNGLRFSLGSQDFLGFFQLGLVQNQMFVLPCTRWSLHMTHLHAHLNDCYVHWQAARGSPEPGKSPSP
jgi:hypothetical protein